MTSTTTSMGLPASVYNLGSQALSVKDFARDKLWRRMGPQMGRKAIQIPVFLVNEEQMDIIFPPRYRKALNPKRIKEILEKRDKDFDIDMLDDMNDWKVYEKIVAVGVYIAGPRSSADVSKVLEKKSHHEVTPEAETAFLSQPAPQIYLCGERIVNRAHDAGVPKDLVLYQSRA